MLFQQASSLLLSPQEKKSVGSLHYYCCLSFTISGPDLLSAEDEIDAAVEVAVSADASAAAAAPVRIAPAFAAAPSAASASAPTTGSFRRMSTLVRRFSDWNNQRRIGSVPNAHFGIPARDGGLDN